jgi:hypothetical protein
MSKLPGSQDVNVKCGQTKEIDAYDKDGDPIRYVIIAESPPPSPPSTGGPSGGTQQHEGGGSGQTDLGGGLRLPGLGGGTTATVRIMDMATGSFPSDADLFVSHLLAPELPINERKEAVVWRVGNVTGTRLTLDLPASFSHTPGDDMMLVIGMDQH